jgi:hypothetical protein
VRAAKKGLTSARRPAFHHGEGLSSLAISEPPCDTVKRWHPRTKSVCCSPKPLRRPRDAHVRIGPGPEYQEKQL